jgi:hypothetical protein
MLGCSKPGGSPPSSTGKPARTTTATAGICAPSSFMVGGVFFSPFRYTAVMRRFLRYLRIAFSATCLIASVLLVVMWVRSYMTEEQPPSFGRSQVKQFIFDRPGVGDVINSKPALQAMLESSFDGDESSGHVYWDCKEPDGPAPAEHHPSCDAHPTLVRVSNHADISSIDKCMMLVYELINSRFDNTYRAYTNMVVAKQISRDDYARSCIRIELSASRKTKEYFQNNPIADENDPDNPDYASLLHASDSLGEYMQWMQSDSYKEYDIFELYRGYYDKIKFGITR